MNVKQYLRQLKRLDNIINAKFEQIVRLRSMMMSVTTNLTDDKIKSSSEPDKLSSVISEIIDLENGLTNDIQNLMTLKQKITLEIDSIQDDDYKLLLTLRYLNYKTWEQIAVEMGYTYQWIHMLHSRALVYFSEKVQGVE